MGPEGQADEFAAIENVRRVVGHGSMLRAIAGCGVKLLAGRGGRGARKHRSAAYWYATEVHPRPILMIMASAGASSFSETAQTPSEWTITSTVSPPEA